MLNSLKNFMDWRLSMPKTNDTFTAIGFVVLALLLMGLYLSLVPWAFYSAVNIVFGAGVEHGFWHYFLFWVMRFTIAAGINIRSTSKG